MTDRDVNLYSCPTIPFMLRSSSFFNIKMHVRVCSHINAFCAIINTSHEMESVLQDDFVGSAKIYKGTWHTSGSCNAPE